MGHCILIQVLALGYIQHWPVILCLNHYGNRIPASTQSSHFSSFTSIWYVQQQSLQPTDERGKRSMQSFLLLLFLSCLSGLMRETKWLVRQGNINKASFAKHTMDAGWNITDYGGSQAFSNSTPLSQFGRFLRTTCGKKLSWLLHSSIHLQNSKLYQ